MFPLVPLIGEFVKAFILRPSSPARSIIFSITSICTFLSLTIPPLPTFPLWLYKGNNFTFRSQDVLGNRKNKFKLNKGDINRNKGNIFFDYSLVKIPNVSPLKRYNSFIHPKLVVKLVVANIYGVNFFGSVL